MIPNEWSSLRELRELYGRELKEISDATLTVHYHQNEKRTGVQKHNEVRYFAHAFNRSYTGENAHDAAARSKELKSPGSHYDEAMRLVYWAARHRLKKIKGEKDEPDQDNWEIAVAYLANQGFRVIRLPEFMSIHRSPGD